MNKYDIDFSMIALGIFTITTGLALALDNGFFGIIALLSGFGLGVYIIMETLRNPKG